VLIVAKRIGWGFLHCRVLLHRDCLAIATIWQTIAALIICSALSFPENQVGFGVIWV